MTIDFGSVQRYIGDRGFGFVSRTFAKALPIEVFFHITVVRRTHQILAQSLEKQDTTYKNIYFWYEYELSRRGQEITSILDLNILRTTQADRVKALLDATKADWENIALPLSESFKKASSYLFMPDEINELAKRREGLLFEQKKRQEEMLRAEEARLQQIEEAKAAKRKAFAAKIQEIAEIKAAQKKVEDEEFRQLVAEMSVLGFIKSSQVSDYIVKHKLGYKYKNISGILQMQLDGDVWNFKGGFPPNIYARLCEALGLGNQGSRAKPGKFTPYKDLDL